MVPESLEILSMEKVKGNFHELSKVEKAFEKLSGVKSISISFK